MRFYGLVWFHMLNQGQIQDFMVGWVDTKKKSLVFFLEKLFVNKINFSTSNYNKFTLKLMVCLVKLFKFKL